MADGFPNVVTEKIAQDNPANKPPSPPEPDASTITKDIPSPPKRKDQFTKSPSPEPAPEPAPVQAREEKVEIELGKKEEDVVEKKTINLKDADFFNNDIDKKTSEANKKEEQPKQKSAENRAITEEPVVDKKLEPEQDDYDFVGGMLVEGLDLATSTAFRWWALDTSDRPYEMTQKKKDKGNT